jgi:hypothetical protein
MPFLPVLQDRCDKVPAADVPDNTIIDGETAWRRRYVAQHGGWISGPSKRCARRG